MYSVIKRRISQLGERKFLRAFARNSSSRSVSTRKDVVTSRPSDACADFFFVADLISSSVVAMRTELQTQNFGSRKVTSQFPRNRHSVANWMAEMDRQRGERIRDLRDAHAWTQRQLADRLGVDPKTVHNWEAGKELNPTNLRELAECLKVSMDYIRYGDREAPDLSDLLNSSGQSQLDRVETELAAIRVEIGTQATQLAEIQRLLARLAESGSLASRSRRAK